jgi:hypothetical protein
VSDLEQVPTPVEPSDPGMWEAAYRPIRSAIRSTTRGNYDDGLLEARKSGALVGVETLLARIAELEAKNAHQIELVDEAREERDQAHALIAELEALLRRWQKDDPYDTVDIDTDAALGPRRPCYCSKTPCECTYDIDAYGRRIEAT